jgi:hypothetical protein
MSLWNDEFNESHYQDLLQLSKKYHIAHQGLEAKHKNKQTHRRVMIGFGSRLSAIVNHLHEFFAGTQAHPQRGTVKTHR